jgi:hypothetical protein
MPARRQIPEAVQNKIRQWAHFLCEFGGIYWLKTGNDILKT